MKQLRIILGILVWMVAITIDAQVITCTPQFPTENDSVTIVFDASQGSAGLKGYTGDVYAHTGLITDQSKSASDWKYGPSWPTNTAKYKLTRIATNLYQFKIKPSIREYYAVAAAEKIQKLAFVFRNTDGSLTGKTSSGGDIFYDVYTSTISLSISLPAIKPVIGNIGDTIFLNAGSNTSDTISLYVDNAFKSGIKGKSLIDTIIITSVNKTWIKVIASKGSDVVSDSFYYFVQGTTENSPMPADVRDGINYLGDTAVTFVLFAPKKKSVFLIGDFNNWMPDNSYLMKKDNDRFWITIGNLEKGKEYIFQYLIDGSIRIADPYSEKVSDPATDKSISSSIYPSLIKYPDGKTSEIAGVIQTGQIPYDWKITNFSAPAKENLIIYELLIRDFTSNRDIKTVTDTLPYLKRLGINAIELMPFSEFEGNDSWGYNPSFYFAPDKAYGTKNDYKKFIDKCHEMGIAVIQDMVLNHSYGQSPLVRMYFEAGKPSVDNPWYNQTSPNTAYSWGYDFNHKSIYTQKLIDSIASFWINEYKIDGFRYDFTKGFTNTPGDGWAYDTARITILKRMAAEVWKRKQDAYVICEHFSDNKEEIILADFGIMIWGNMNKNYGQAAMSYNDAGGSWDLSGISYKNLTWSKPGLVGYMESHDEERIAYKCEKWGKASGSYDTKLKPVMCQRIALNNLFFLTIPGPKMIWQFGELGYDINIDSFGRVGIKPDKWEYQKDADRANIYNMIRTLNGLRQNESIFSTGNFTLSTSGKVKRITLVSDSGDETVIIVGNFDVTEQTATVPFPTTGTWYNFFSNSEENIDNTSFSIKLQPGEYRMYSNKKINQPSYTGIANNTMNSEIGVYPNPCGNMLNISNLKLTKNIQIFDISGRSMQFNFKTGNNSINVSNLNSGVYLLQITNENGKRELTKFVKR